MSKYQDTPELRERVIRAWNKGVSRQDMGMLGICPAYLSKKILEELGVDIKLRGKKRMIAITQ